MLKLSKNINYKKVCFFGLALVIVSLLLISYKLGKNSKKDNYNNYKEDSVLLKQYHTIQLIKSGNKFIDSLRIENIKHREDINKSILANTKLEQQEKKISESYTNVYIKIKNVSDSIQYIITDSLLSKHRKIKFERN